MNPFRSSALIAYTAALLLIFLSGCASPVSKFVAYRPPGKSANLGIEVISYPQVPPRFELKIDGQYVMELRWKSAFDYHSSATGTYNGKPVRMMGRFVPGNYIIDVFIDNDRCANFTFP
jgi:hypothetical protein